MATRRLVKARKYWRLWIFATVITIGSFLGYIQLQGIQTWHSGDMKCGGAIVCDGFFDINVPPRVTNYLGEWFNITELCFGNNIKLQISEPEKVKNLQFFKADKRYGVNNSLRWKVFNFSNSCLSVGNHSFKLNATKEPQDIVKWGVDNTDIDPIWDSISKSATDLNVSNTTSKMKIDGVDINVYATVGGTKRDISNYLSTSFTKRTKDIKFGFMVNVPGGVLGNNLVNNLQSFIYEVANASTNLEAISTGFRYSIGRTQVDQFIATDDYVVYDFSDILSHFTYKMNTTDENNKTITIDVPVDYQIVTMGKTATISFNMTQIKFLAGQTINLDPSVSISNVATYSPQVSINVTTEAYPLSHITMNDSAILLYLPFDVNFTASPNNVTYDYSGKHNNVFSFNNTIWNTTGYIGSGITFRGIDGNWVNMSSINRYVNTKTTNVTFSMWIKEVQASSAGRTALKFQTNGVSTGFSITYGAGGSRNASISYRNSTGIYVLYAHMLINDSQWHQVTATIAGTNATIYIDGLSGDSTNTFNSTQSFSGGAMPGYLGMGFPYAGDTWNGSIDEVIIWNRTISSDEISALYNNQFGRYYQNNTQLFQNVSIGQDSTIDSVNITTNTTQLNGTSMQLQLWYYNSTGANTANSSWQSVTTGNNQVTSFTGTIPVTIYNISLFFNFSSNAFAGYSPIISDSINITSWTQGNPSINISIQNPTNTTYSNASSIYNLTFNYTINSSILTTDKCWYKLNSTANVSLPSCTNGTVMIDIGWSNITFFINSTTGIQNSSSTIFFTFTQIAAGAFNITIQNPTNTTYTNASTQYNMTVNFTTNLNGKTLDKQWYNLNQSTGSTSTTIQLIDNATELIEDVAICQLGAVQSSLNISIYLKFNISSIPVGATIQNATLGLYINNDTAATKNWTNKTDIYRVNNQTWTQNDNVANLNNTPKDTLISNYSAYVPTPPWMLLNVTDIVRTDYNAGNKNTSFQITTPEYKTLSPTGIRLHAVGIENAATGNKAFMSVIDRTNATYHEYLNITYSISGTENITVTDNFTVMIDQGLNNLVIGINATDGTYNTSFVNFTYTMTSVSNTCTCTNAQPWTLNISDNCNINGITCTPTFLTLIATNGGQTNITSSTITCTNHTWGAIIGAPILVFGTGNTLVNCMEAYG